MIFCRYLHSQVMMHLQNSSSGLCVWGCNESACLRVVCRLLLCTCWALPGLRCEGPGVCGSEEELQPGCQGSGCWSSDAGVFPCPHTPPPAKQLSDPVGAWVCHQPSSRVCVCVILAWTVECGLLTLCVCVHEFVCLLERGCQLQKWVCVRLYCVNVPLTVGVKAHLCLAWEPGAHWHDRIPAWKKHGLYWPHIFHEHKGCSYRVMGCAYIA